ncbi:MAG TPA: histidine phosphatase family protein [Thermopetrobacter sp.]|nr:histidine phosphatase family protein [Thermopetrobacter sp.]
MSAPLCYFIRHGETDWNARRRVQGHADTALNDRGRAQARGIARRLRALEPDLSSFTIYASPLRRVRQTLEPILEAYGLSADAVIFDDRLRERDFGVWEGSVWEELLAAGINPWRSPREYYFWRPEGGESYADVAVRVSEFLAGMRHPAVIVSHGGVHRVLRGLMLDLPPEEVARLRVPQDRFCRLAPGRIEWFEAGVP